MIGMEIEQQAFILQRVDNFCDLFPQRDLKLKSNIHRYEKGESTYYVTHAEVKNLFIWTSCLLIMWQQAGQIKFGYMKQTTGFPFVPNKDPIFKEIIALDLIENIKSQSGFQIEIQAGSKLAFRFFDAQVKKRWLYILTVLYFYKGAQADISLERTITGQTIEYYLIDSRLQEERRQRQRLIEIEAITHVTKHWKQNLMQTDNQLRNNNTIISQLQASLQCSKEHMVERVNQLKNSLTALGKILQCSVEQLLERVQELKNNQIKSRRLNKIFSSPIGQISEKVSEMRDISKDVAIPKLQIAQIQERQKITYNINRLYTDENLFQLQRQNINLRQQLQQKQQEVEDLQQEIKRIRIFALKNEQLSAIFSNFSHSSLQKRNLSSYVQNEHSFSRQDLMHYLDRSKNKQNIIRQEQDSERSFSLVYNAARKKYGEPIFLDNQS